MSDNLTSMDANSTATQDTSHPSSSIVRAVQAAGRLLPARSPYRVQFSLLFQPIPSGVPPDFNPEEVGVYPLLPTGAPDVNATEHSALERSWAPNSFDYPGARGVTNPLTVAQQALRMWNRHLNTGSMAFTQRAMTITEWLISNQTAEGAWLYEFPFHDLQPGWSSAMAQGEAISALVRAHHHTGKARFLDAARRAYAHMEVPVEAGGTLAVLDSRTSMYEEYPGSTWAPHVLNGSIFALIGVYDLAAATQDPGVQSRFAIMTESLAARLEQYDTGWWSSYALSKNHEVASPEYHRLHVQQLEVMAAYTGDSRWSERATRWRGYATHNWWRLLWHKGLASRL